MDVRSGRDYKHLSIGEIPVYGTGGYMLSVNEALSYDEDAIGIGRKGTIDKPYVLKAPFWTVDTLFYVVPNLKNNLDFIHSIFQKINWRQKDESTGVPSLSKVAINSILVFITQEKEQTKIGNFFQQLDNLIAQHQQKHDKLLNIKKALLEKMFPKQGETIPSIRFKGFSEAWEEKALGDVCDVRDGTHNSPKYVPIGHLFITSKNVKNGYINYDDVQYISQKDFDDINKRSKVDVNDILMGMIGTIGNIALVRQPVNFAIKNVALIKNINLANYLYVYTFLQSLMTVSQLEEGMDGGTQKFVSLNRVRKLSVALPRCSSEQTQIGNFFQQLDSLIEQHQSQRTKLNNIKQSMLSKMFV